MTRVDFTRRLAAIGKTQTDIARACRVQVSSVYCWGHGDKHPFPAHVTALVEAWERIAELEAGAREFAEWSGARLVA